MSGILSRALLAALLLGLFSPLQPALALLSSDKRLATENTMLGKSSSRHREPLAYWEVENALLMKGPSETGIDGALASEIREHGISFRMDSAIQRCLLERFPSRPLVLKALKSADDRNRTQGKFLQRAVPVCEKTKVLVANFVDSKCSTGVEQLGLHITEEVRNRLESATVGYDDIDVEPLGKTIPIQEGKATALKVATERGADVVLWGSYCVKKEVEIDARFELVGSPYQLAERDFQIPLLKDIFMGRHATIPGSRSELERGSSLEIRVAAQMSYLALLASAIARLRAGDYGGALERCARALQEWSGPQAIVPRARALLVQALAYYSQEKLDKAISSATDAIGLDSNSGFNYAIRATFHDSDGNYKNAVEDLARASELEPENAGYHLLLGWVHASNEKYIEAVAELERAIKLEPRNPEGYFARAVIQLGRAYHAMTNAQNVIQDLILGGSLPSALDKALSSLKAQATKLDSASGEVEALSGLSDFLGKFLTIVEEYDQTLADRTEAADKAIAALSQSIDLEANSSRPSISIACPIACAATYLIVRGFAYGQKSKNMESRRMLNEGKKILPIVRTWLEARIDSLRVGGASQEYLKREEEARNHVMSVIPEFIEFTKLSKNPPELDQTGEQKEQVDYDEAARLGSNNADIYFIVGQAHWTNGRLDKAIKYFGKAIEVDPYNGAYYHELARVYAEHGDHGHEMANYLKAVEYEPTCGDLQYDFGMAYLGEKKYEKAIACFKLAVEQDEEWAEALYQLGHTQRLAGDSRSAALNLKKVLQLKISSELRQEAQNELLGIELR
jgi:tetratricopeptide (TPR) repeat protein